MTSRTAALLEAGVLVDGADLTGPQKSAVLLMALGTERASRVLRELQESEITEIMAEVAQLRAVPSDVVDAVLEEFDVTARARRHIASGGMEVAKEFLDASMGKDKADEIFERLSVTFVTAVSNGIFNCVLNPYMN